MRNIVFGLGMALALAAGAGAEWQVETVADAYFHGANSPLIAVSRQGQPHISFRTGYPDYELAYFYRAADGWKEEAVDAGGNLEPVALSVDDRGVVYLYYVDREKRLFKSATRTDSGWEIAAVDPGVEFGNVAALRDDRGCTHIAYYDAKNGNLKYVRSDGRTWTTETIANNIIVEGPVAISVDGSGEPRITYFRKSRVHEVELTYARGDGEEFGNAIIKTLSISRLFQSLAVDKQGRAHLAYFDFTGPDLKYLNLEAPSSISTSVDNRRWVGEGNAIAVRSNGKPCISYYSRYRLKFAYDDGRGWSVRTVDTMKDLRYGPGETKTALALDGKDTPHIAYYDWVAEKVMYATWEGADWRPTTVDAGEVDIDRSRAALTARWSDAGALVEPGEPWRPTVTPDRYYDDRGAPSGIPLRTQPRKDAPIVTTIKEDTRVEVIDGRSVWGAYVNGLLDEEVNTYFVWLKVRAGGVEGWVNQLPFRRGFVGGESPMWEAVVDMTRVTFTAPYGSLREGPSSEYPVVREEWGPGIKAGSTYTVLARCGDWLCVKGAWLPLDTAGLGFEYLGFIWEPYEDALFCFYLPRGNEIGRIFYTYRAYFKLAELPDEGPLLSIKTTAGEFAIVPKTLRHYGFHETSQGDYEVVISPPVRREDIEAVTFTVGAGGERIKFTLDPREAWAEYDAGR